MALPLIATIHAARLEARFIKAMVEGRAWLGAPIRGLPEVRLELREKGKGSGWDAEPEAATTATPHITTRADIEEVDRLRAELKRAYEEIARLQADLGRYMMASNRTHGD